MKKLLVAALASVTLAGAAQAGGIAAEIKEEVVVVKPASSISPIAILAILLVIGLLVSQGDDNQQQR